MIYNVNKAVSQVWARVYVGPTPIECSKYAFKDKETIARVRLIGSKRVVAFTQGIYEAEDTVIEMPAMQFYGLFLPSLGATSSNPTLTQVSSREFEIVETIRDPDFLAGAGDVTNIAKGCRVIGFEKATENTEAAVMVSVTVAIREIAWGLTSQGGAGASLAG
jgi:hypothetical protein